MKKLFQRLRYKLPKTLNKIWWNQTAHIEKCRFPILKWEGISYLDCEEGLIVPMQKLKNGKYAFYKIIKIYRKSGGDWLYDSDNIDCDMEFHSIHKKVGIGNRSKKKNGYNFVSLNP